MVLAESTSGITSGVVSVAADGSMLAVAAGSVTSSANSSVGRGALATASIAIESSE